MTQYCPVMGQKTSAVLYYLPCADSSSIAHRGRDILFVPQHGCQKAFDTLQVVVDDGWVCVGTLPWINHLLPLSISGHADAGSENTAQVTKELGLGTHSHCKTVTFDDRTTYPGLGLADPDKVYTMSMNDQTMRHRL